MQRGGGGGGGKGKPTPGGKGDVTISNLLRGNL